MLTLQHHFGKYYYAVLINPVDRIMKFRCIMKYLRRLQKGGLVLDYGSGDRPLEPMLNERFDKYIAADYEASNAGHMRRPDIPIVDYKLGIESNSLDCVILTEVLEHIYEPKAALQEINRVLKPGGSLIGTVPFAVSEHEPPFDFHRYTSFALKRMFDETGFNLVELEYVGDSVGVAITSVGRVFDVFTKAIHKLKAAKLAKIVQGVIRLPEMIYYGAVRIGLDPGKIGYYRNYPLGFAFHVTKPVDDS